ncbi:hypothetical protein [Amycolatopsis sp. H20-H5]|uniref:hypothetical protein n=1 Tax=Amycolatopsis sp. H20-H5 TaxID=3046309 RepID=UPI002DBDA42F|nr:hypothetical protein [Amycolatopsis sp. H20-H5]MEC3980761.1 hypothetical protein [Amycolatopsis sp. H20-H5]
MNTVRWLAVLVATSAMALAGCTGTPVQGSAAPQGSAASRPSTAEPSKTSAPQAADGTDLSACSDGTCQVRVTVSAKITLPASTRVESLTVTAIADGHVTLTGHDIGNRHGGASIGECSLSSNNNDLTMVVGVSGSCRPNNLRVDVVSVDGDSAVLSIAPIG